MNMYGHTPNRGRAAVYARRSHWDDGVSLSVITQAANGRRQAELMGFTVGDEDVFLDDGVSGMTDDRPGFKGLLLKIFSPERRYKAIIVTDISRLSRSSSSYFEYEEIFAEEGIELISLMEPPSNPQVKIDSNRRMKAVMNEDQVVNVAVKTRASQMMAVEAGFYIGWVAPFGYRKKKAMWRGEEHTKLERDPETWPHLLHIKDMAKTNCTLSQIRQYLEGTGLKHPAGSIDKKKNQQEKGGKRGTGRWTNDNASYLLKHLALLGWTFRGGEHSGSKILHKSDQVICRDAHEAAMTEEERELIIRNLASRRREVKNSRIHRSPNLMGELTACGMCGATMRMHTENGTQRLICANRREYKKGEANWCPNPSVRLDVLMERVIDALLGHILTPKVLQHQVRLVAKENRGFAATQESRKKQLEKRIQKLEQEIGNFMAAIAEYGPSNPGYGREIDRRQEETALLQRERDMISSELQKKLAFVNEPDRIVENGLNMRTYLETEDQHSLKEMLKSLIRKASIVNRVATLDYTVPLPRNRTEEPILMEKLGLDKKTCPSVGLTGVRARPPALVTRVVLERRGAPLLTVAKDLPQYPRPNDAARGRAVILSSPLVSGATVDCLPVPSPGVGWSGAVLLVTVGDWGFSSANRVPDHLGIPLVDEPGGLLVGGLADDHRGGGCTGGGADCSGSLFCPCDVVLVDGDGDFDGDVLGFLVLGIHLGDNVQQERGVEFWLCYESVSSGGFQVFGQLFGDLPVWSLQDAGVPEVQVLSEEASEIIRHLCFVCWSHRVVDRALH